MEDIQKFLLEYTKEVHTIREILSALEEKGLSKEEADKEFKIWMKSSKTDDYDEYRDYFEIMKRLK